MPRTTHILTTCCSCHLSQVSHRVVSSELCHIELPVVLCSCHLCHHTVTLLTAVEPWGVCLGLGPIFNLICVSVVCVCITCVLLFCRLRDPVTFLSSVLLSIKCVSGTSVVSHVYLSKARLKYESWWATTPVSIHQPVDPMRADKVCMLGECVRSTTTTRKGRARESEPPSPHPAPSHPTHRWCHSPRFNHTFVSPTQVSSSNGRQPTGKCQQYNNTLNMNT